MVDLSTCGRSLTVLGHRTGLTLRFMKVCLGSLMVAVKNTCCYQVWVKFYWTVCGASLWAPDSCRHNEWIFFSFFLHQACVVLNHVRKRMQSYSYCIYNSISSIYTETRLLAMLAAQWGCTQTQQHFQLNAAVTSLTCSQWWCNHADVYQVRCSLC